MKSDLVKVLVLPHIINVQLLSYRTPFPGKNLEVKSACSGPRTTDEPHKHRNGHTNLGR